MNVSDVGFRDMMGKISVKWVYLTGGHRYLTGGAVPPRAPLWLRAWIGLYIRMLNVTLTLLTRYAIIIVSYGV